MLKDVVRWLNKEGLTSQSFYRLNGVVYPSKELIINIHNFLIKYFRGDSDEIHRGAVKEANIDHVLDYIQYRMPTEVNAEESLVKKSAYLMHYFFTSHTFTDGNKRTAFIVSMLFLTLNIFPQSIKKIPDYQKNVIQFKKWASKKTNDKKSLTEIQIWFRRYI